jgi:hypothetical protein
MKALAPILRLFAIALIDFKTWHLHPLSDYTAQAVIRRNNLERPM